MLHVVTGILILLLFQERGVVGVVCSRRHNVTYWILTLCDLNTCTVLCDSHVVTGSVDERTCSSIVCVWIRSESASLIKPVPAIILPDKNDS
jgi:hypothetical protein